MADLKDEERQSSMCLLTNSLPFSIKSHFVSISNIYSFNSGTIFSRLPDLVQAAWHEMVVMLILLNVGYQCVSHFECDYIYSTSWERSGGLERKNVVWRHVVGRRDWRNGQ